MSVEVLTFGCRLNIAESAAMRTRATEAGLSDALLVNTCAVTSEAVRQARQAIRRARRAHPGRPVVVAGCAAQTEPGVFAAMDEVDLVLGNSEKLTVAAYRPMARWRRESLAAAERVRVGDIMTVRAMTPHVAEAFEGHTRAFVQVQNGCDHRCTFCTIPFGRGPSRSTPMDIVVDHISRLVDSGFREVVLTGVDIASYGGDLAGTPRLGALVRRVLKQVPALPRLRLSSLDCLDNDPELLRALADEERLMPHLHLSLQSGDDLILKRMKRRHSRADAIRFCAEIRRLRPDIVFGADFIAGFPTETNVMFDNTLALVDDCGLSRLHVFPFSARAGVPAARMPQVPRALARERAARLRTLGAAALAAWLATEPGRVRSVLVEAGGVGRTEHFATVALDRGAPGELVPVHIRSASATSLAGEVLPKAIS